MVVGLVLMAFVDMVVGAVLAVFVGMFVFVGVVVGMDMVMLVAVPAHTGMFVCMFVFVTVFVGMVMVVFVVALHSVLLCPGHASFRENCLDGMFFLRPRTGCSNTGTLSFHRHTKWGHVSGAPRKGAHLSRGA